MTADLVADVIPTPACQVDAHVDGPATAQSEGEARRAELIEQVRAEFLEMPGLSLTLPQAQRLWSIEPHTCEVLFKSLTESHFLRRTSRGRFVLRATRV